MQLNPEQFARYEKAPADDAWLRQALKLPDSRYYSVSMSGPTLGRIRLTGKRESGPKKISKSDQPAPVCVIK